MSNVSESKMKATFTAIATLTAALIVLPISGCGGEDLGYETGEVSGTVTFDGQPVTEGSITFYSESLGANGTADLGEEGAFQIRGARGEGLRVGSYVVRMSPPPQDLGDGDPNVPAPKVEPKEYPNIPKKYRDSKTSGLTAEVKAGPNEFKFDMTGN